MHLGVGHTCPKLRSASVDPLPELVARPDWLEMPHRRLDEMVRDAYGWPREIGDEEVLARLLALILERAGARQKTAGEAEEAVTEESPGV